MAALAINLLALLIVLGMCWAAMMWLAGRSHGFGGRNTEYEFETVEYRDDSKVIRRGRVDSTGVENGPTGAIPRQAHCTVCEGVGAHHIAGRLAPCPECYGTGVLG